MRLVQKSFFVLIVTVKVKVLTLGVASLHEASLVTEVCPGMAHTHQLDPKGQFTPVDLLMKAVSQMWMQ